MAGPLRLAFMGSPGFSVPALQALAAAGHTIVGVYTQAPRPANRGQAITRCAVHVAADAMGLAVHHPVSLRRDTTAQAEFAAMDLDAAIVAAYGLILPQAMLDAPRRGCLNIHASLLPRWRGAGPIQAAVLAGDERTGVTIMLMEAGLDTGPMLLRETVPIGPRATAATVHDALSALGAGLVLRALAERPPAVAQPGDGVTYAPKLARADAAIDWTRSAAMLDRQVRAFDPWPGTVCKLGGAPLKVLSAVPVTADGEPGTVIDAQLTVACGDGGLRLLHVQRAGRAPMDAAAFLRGHPVPPGTRLD